MTTRWCDRCGAFKATGHEATDHEATDHQPSLLDDIEPQKQARFEDPDTSRKAARMLDKLRVGSMRRALLRAYEQDDLTAEEAAKSAGFGAEAGAWKRVSDLLRDGLLEDTGRTRTASTGRQQRVLRISDSGKAAL